MAIVRGVEDGTVTLYVAGGGAAALRAPSIRSELDAIADGRIREVALDISELTILDSAGVAAAVSLHERLLRRGCELRIVGVCEQPARVFELLGLDRALRIERRRLA